jgi:glycosyltransferase involved in cell wall biosynthesis
LIVLDTAAQGYDGHSFAYSAEALKAAAEEGLATVFLGSTALRDAPSPATVHVVHCFTRDCYGRWAPRQPLSNRIFLALGRSLERVVERLRPLGLRWRASLAARAVERWFLRIRFAVELVGALRRIGAGPDDILFMHTLDESQVGGWAIALSAVPARRVPTTALLFRHNLGLSEADCRSWAAVSVSRGLARIRASRAGQRVHFVSDSRRLAEQHRRLTGFDYLAVPNVVPAFQPGGPIPRETGVFHFVYLGNVRAEKGFALLLDAIRELPRLPGLDINFTLQATPNLGRDDDYYQTAMAKAKTLADRGVRLVTRMLSPGEYDALLRSADAVLVPYEPRTYHARTSQIFSEAIAAGRLVVVPADTWMAEQLDEMRGGGVAFEPYEPAALAKALADVASDPGRYTADPEALRQWCADNSARALVRLLRGLKGDDRV